MGVHASRRRGIGAHTEQRTMGGSKRIVGAEWALRLIIDIEAI
jgi:hypothetical protein